MPSDNSTRISNLKTQPPPVSCPRPSWQPPLHPEPTAEAAMDHSPPPPYRQIPSFISRPFPPPALADVPVDYIVDRLRSLAPHYWNKQETADCTIIVPVPHLRGRSMRAPDMPSLPSMTRDPSGLGRGSEPTLHMPPRISLKLHMDYLSAQSTFLRGLFSGASPLNLISSNPDAPPTFDTGASSQQFTVPTSSQPFTVPTNRLPRLLPSSPSHPIIFLPVPDPTSFHLLVHWIYFGHTNYIEECLTQGVIQWEGLARNVEYLGLSTDIKIFLGRWYGSWLHPGRSRKDGDSLYDDDDSDDDDDSHDESADSFEDDMGDEDDDPEEAERGRARLAQRLANKSSRPRSA